MTEEDRAHWLTGVCVKETGVIVAWKEHSARRSSEREYQWLEDLWRGGCSTSSIRRVLLLQAAVYRHRGPECRSHRPPRVYDAQTDRPLYVMVTTLFAGGQLFRRRAGSISAGWLFLWMRTSFLASRRRSADPRIVEYVHSSLLLASCMIRTVVLSGASQCITSVTTCFFVRKELCGITPRSDNHWC